MAMGTYHIFYEERMSSRKLMMMIDAVPLEWVELWR